MNKRTMILPAFSAKRQTSSCILKDEPCESGTRAEVAIDGSTVITGTPSRETPAVLTSLGEESGGAKLTLHVHGENFCHGDRFYQTMTERIPTGTYETSEQGPVYKFTAADPYMILDAENTRFRKNTVYSFRIHFLDPKPSSLIIYPQFAIVYSDGTVVEMANHGGKLKDNLYCEISEAGKTVVGVQHKSRSNKKFTLITEDFAVLEGAREVDDFYAYTGGFPEIPLAEPLRGIQSGSAFYCDRFLYGEKKVYRRIRNAMLDLASAEATEGGCFRIPLAERACLLAPDIVSDVFKAVKTPEEVAEGPYRAALSSDRLYLYFSLSEGADEGDLAEEFTDFTPTVLYVRENAGEESVSFTAPVIPANESVYYELFSSVQPRKMLLIPSE